MQLRVGLPQKGSFYSDDQFIIKDYLYVEEFFPGIFIETIAAMFNLSEFFVPNVNIDISTRATNENRGWAIIHVQQEEKIGCEKLIINSVKRSCASHS